MDDLHEKNISLINLSEGADIEFKEAQGRKRKGTFPKSALETYSAFANTNGGRIFLGFRDNGDIIGIADSKKVQKEFWDAVNDKKRVSENLLNNENVTVGEKGSIIIEVPPATRRQRPIFIGENPLTGTYLRNFEGDYKATQESVKRMLADQVEGSTDSEIIEFLRIEDLDKETILQYRNLFKSSSPDHPFLSANDEELLRCLGAMKLNRETQKLEVTIAGLLVFGDQTLIKETFPAFNLDYQEHDDSDLRWIDRVSTDGSWTGNLFQFYRRVLPRLTEKLKIPFFLDENHQRKETTRIHKALREALVNSLIHTDYRRTTSVRIVKKTNVVEFRNPGRLRVSKEQFFRGNTSDCRNPSVQNIFRMIGAGEKAGSGGLLIQQAWEEKEWKKPVICVDYFTDTTTLTLSFETLWSSIEIEKLRVLFPDFNRLEMNEKIAVVAASIEGSVTHPSLSLRVKLHPRDLTLMLYKLTKEGYLVNDSHNRRSVYKLGKGSPQLELFNPLGSSIDSDSDSTNYDSNSNSNSTDSDLSSANYDSDSINSDSSSTNSDLSSTNSDLSSTNSDSSSTNSDARFQRIIKPLANTRRYKTNDVKKAIVALCEVEPLSLRRLAELLNRTPNQVRNYIKPLLADGHLQLLYPENPKHPKQKYSSVKKARIDTPE